MRVSEAIEILSKMNPDDELVIKNGQVGIGPIAATKVKGLHAGFDWDNGRVFVEPKDALRLETELDRIAAKLLRKVVDIQAIEDMMAARGEPVDKKLMTRRFRELCEKALEEIDGLRR